MDTLTSNHCNSFMHLEKLSVFSSKEYLHNVTEWTKWLQPNTLLFWGGPGRLQTNFHLYFHNVTYSSEITSHFEWLNWWKHLVLSETFSIICYGKDDVMFPITFLRKLQHFQVLFQKMLECSFLNDIYICTRVQHKIFGERSGKQDCANMQERCIKFYSRNTFIFQQITWKSQF